MVDENVFNGDVGVIKYILYSNTSRSKKDEIYVAPFNLANNENSGMHLVISDEKGDFAVFEYIVLPLLSPF